MYQNAYLLAECLRGISESSVTSDQFGIITGIASKSVTNEVLDFLLENGIGKYSKEKNLISFSSSDRIRASILAVSLGADIQKVAYYLSWKDFEIFASEVLRNCGFHTMNNVRFVKPRAEIDVVATKLDFALSIDCKHWADNRSHKLSAPTTKQLQRAKRLLEYSPQFKAIVPVLLTIYPADPYHAINLVPIVDINRFKVFIEEIEMNLDKVYYMTND